MPTIEVMAIPTRVQAARILHELDPPEWLVIHSTAVAEIAAFLAARITSRGLKLDTAVVEAAALLHDLDKTLPQTDPLRKLGHGSAGAAWLTRRGHPELARAVANHPATLLSDEERYSRWAAFASREERVVAYADKRAMQDVVPLAERFGRWAERHPEHEPSIRLARGRAERLERDVCAAAGIAPTDVARVHWVAAAMASTAE